MIVTRRLTMALSCLLKGCTVIKVRSRDAWRWIHCVTGCPGGGRGGGRDGGRGRGGRGVLAS